VTAALYSNEIETPAFVYSESVLSSTASRIRSICEDADCRFLFSTKPACLSPIIEFLSDHVDGYSVSSRFDALIVAGSKKLQQTIHHVSPAIKSDDFGDLTELCNTITANSLRQAEALLAVGYSSEKVGLRINPHHSYLSDPRYDPCRKGSKLGIQLDMLPESKSNEIRNIFSGVHIHNNCESLDLNELRETVDSVLSKATWIFKHANWVNLGGGYFLNEDLDTQPLVETVQRLKGEFGLDVFIEPGNAVVRDAGCLVATVLDVIEGGDCPIAILDTSVNHMPEVFEYQFQPDVASQTKDGDYKVILAGCSCLAGDCFGEYCFSEPIRVGKRIIFEKMGAYTISKWNFFNGINLPTIYSIDSTGNPVVQKKFSFRDYIFGSGADQIASF